MYILLVIAAVIGGFAGFSMLSQATLGVGLVALGCLAAILGRIAQATAHHNELLQATRTPDAKKTTSIPAGAAMITCEHCGTLQPRGPAKCQNCGHAL